MKNIRRLHYHDSGIIRPLVNQYRQTVDRMNWLAVFLFSVMIGGSVAAQCASDAKLDPRMISDTYFNAAKSVPVPILEKCDFGSVMFAETFGKAIADLGLAINRNIYAQAENKGVQLIDAVQRSSEGLRQSIDSIKKENNKGEVKSLEAAVEQLTSELKEFLSWQPGNAVITPRPLPDLPKQQTEIKSVVKNHSGIDLFVNLPETFEVPMSSLFGYLEATYLAGWRRMRSATFIVQEQFRKQILNGPVMDACRLAIDQVLGQSDFVRAHIGQMTWESFKDVAERVVKISDDYKASKNYGKC